MKVAVVGSRNLIVNDLQNYLPKETIEIVSGGARGIDTCAREYALKNNLILKEFKPEYSKYGKVAPLKRNLEIINYADKVLIFWDGKSRGSKFVIDECKKINKEYIVYYAIAHN